MIIVSDPFSIGLKRNNFYNFNIETTKGCERLKIYYEIRRQGLTVRPSSSGVLSNAQIQKIVHVIKPAQFEVADVVEADRSQDIISSMIGSRLGGFKNADFQGEYRKNVSIVPVS